MKAVPHNPPLGTLGDWKCECGFISNLENQEGHRSRLILDPRLEEKGAVQELLSESSVKSRSVAPSLSPVALTEVQIVHH